MAIVLCDDIGYGMGIVVVDVDNERVGKSITFCEERCGLMGLG